MSLPKNIPVLVHYYINNISFDSEEPVEHEEKKHNNSGELSIGFELGKNEDTPTDYKLALLIKTTPDYHPSTKVSAKITGFFRFEEECPEGERERMITLQGLTTLYSLLRGYVGSLTASSPLGLTMLPMIMMKDVIEQAREKQKELSSQKSS